MVSAPVSYVNFDSVEVAKTTQKASKAKKTAKYDWLNILIWFVAVPLGALLWIGFMTWLLYIIF